MLKGLGGSIADPRSKPIGDAIWSGINRGVWTEDSDACLGQHEQASALGRCIGQRGDAIEDRRVIGNDRLDASSDSFSGNFQRKIDAQHGRTERGVTAS